VNVVAPGHTATDPTGSRLSTEARAAMAETLVPGRWMSPEEQANAVIWLCSEGASGITGAIVNVNGGNYMPSG
jgi:NAD(P)-dependent dehydrogenase (short-subunit alcohol dehydrogenase family)